MATCNNKHASIMDDTWMLPDSDPWLTFQDAVKCLNDVVNQLEENFDETYDDLTLRLTGVEKQELDRTRQLTTDFIHRWESKCKETENLRLSLKRVLHESTRVNDEYHEMEESVSKMRCQFGAAIDSSVTEIEELAICNNSLSERVEELELKVKSREKNLRLNAEENLKNLRKIVAFSQENDVTVKSLVNRLENEARQIDRFILMENYTQDDEISSTNLMERSHKMRESISQGLLETMKKELKESRNISESQKQRILTLEKEKEEFIQNQLIAINDGDKEIKDLLDYLHKFTNREKLEIREDVSELSKFKRNVKLTKNIIKNLNSAADKTYKQHSNVTGNISELKENIGDLNEKLKEYAIRIDDTIEERNMFKRKHEHNETQIDILNNEISSLQTRINSIDKERKNLYDENIELKSGTASMENHFSVLNVENKELLEQIKTLQKERDDLFALHEDDVYKLNQICQEKNETEEQYENLENAITKIRREYQDQNREVSMLSKENEDLKRIVEDAEEDRRKIRSNMKALETMNRDLEDLNFEVKSDLQKLESESKKLQQTCSDYKNNISDLDEKIQTLEKLKIDSILKNADQEKENKSLRDKIKTMEKTNQKSQERVDKRTLLLGLYEKLVIKLLHHMKEVGISLDCEVENHPGSVLCSSMSLEYKEKNEIEASLNETSMFSDVLLQAITSCLLEKQKQNITSLNNEKYNEVFLENKDLLNSIKKMKANKRKLRFTCKFYFREIRRLRTRSTRQRVEKCEGFSQTEESFDWKTQVSFSKQFDNTKLLSRLRILLENLEKVNVNIMVVMENNVRERLKKDVTHIIDEMQQIIDQVTSQNNSYSSTTNVSSTIKDDGLDERLESIQNQRQYMLDHMSSTNKRLEVLLNTLKGRQNKTEISDTSKNVDEPTNNLNPFNKQRVSTEARSTFKKDEIVLNKAANILELTKAMTINDVSEIGTETAVDDNQREVFGAVKVLNKNVDSVLREARSNISSASKRKLIANFETKNGEDNLSDNTPVTDDVIPKSEFLKVESELKDSLQKAQEKVELLSNFLAERESEIQERDRIIAQLNKEYEKLKTFADNKNDINIATRDRIIKEYKAAKERLEQENEFLQHVVKELRQELYKLQQNVRKEEDKHKHLEEFIDDLQMNKKALEISLDKMAMELSILQRDREQLIYSFQNLTLKPTNQSINYPITQTNNPVNQPSYPVNQFTNSVNQLNHSVDQSNHQVKQPDFPVAQPSNPFGTNNTFPPYTTNLYNPNQQQTNKIPSKFVNINNVINPGMEYVQKFEEKEKFAYVDMSANNRSLIHAENLHPVHIQQGDLQRYPHHSYPDKGFILHNDLSTSTAIPHSEDDLYLCTSCDECDSLPSDNEDVMSSADSHTTSSSIKVARNISTDKATETIKSRNRPVKYVQKEIDSGLALISPRTQAKFRRRSLESVDSPRLQRTPSSSSSNATSEGRVMGRREQRYYSQEGPHNNGHYDHFPSDMNFRRFDPSRLSYDSRKKTLEQIGRNYYDYHNDHDQHQISKLRSNSTEYFKSDNKHPKVPRERAYRNPVPDIDLAIERASLEVEKQYLKEQQKYIQSKQILDSSFRNPNFEKKKKKKFLSFGKR